MAKKPRREKDPNVTAFSTVQQFTERAGQEAPKPAREKNPAAVALGRLGGLKGGKARAAALTKKERAEIAKKAASVRWASRSH